jgi:hypothetical protein
MSGALNNMANYQAIADSDCSSIDTERALSKSPRQPTIPHPQHGEGQAKKLGLWTFCVLAFYSVNGGAFGIEDIVRAGIVNSHV